MKCFYEMKKKELLNEAIKMRQALLQIANMDLAYIHANFPHDALASGDAYAVTSGLMCGFAKRALMTDEELEIFDSLYIGDDAVDPEDLPFPEVEHD